jgi:hypothetical protein
VAFGFRSCGWRNSGVAYNHANGEFSGSATAGGIMKEGEIEVTNSETEPCEPTPPSPRDEFYHSCNDRVDRNSSCFQEIKEGLEYITEEYET